MHGSRGLDDSLFNAIPCYLAEYVIDLVLFSIAQGWVYPGGSRGSGAGGSPRGIPSEDRPWVSLEVPPDVPPEVPPEVTPPPDEGKTREHTGDQILGSPSCGRLDLRIWPRVVLAIIINSDN